MPANIPHDLAVDITTLENDHDHITAGQIVLPKGVELVSPADLVVISVSLPRGAAVEEESAPAAETPAEAPAAA
jgi:large subunit ribosomal protein L25